MGVKIIRLESLRSAFDTEALASYPRSEEWNLKIFSNRDEALDWLLSEKKQSDNLA